MRQDVKDIVKICRAFYTIIHFLAFFLFLQTNNQAVSTTFSSIFFWGLKLAAGILFFIAGNNPGYITKIELKSCNELQDTDWKIPNQHYCEICKILQPYRARHCFDCEECISKFDHHCFWLGSCVGELNHFKFAFYLILECFSLTWAVYFCFFGTTYIEIAFYIILGITCASFAMLTGGLGIFHAYLISIGATTWEIMRRKSITYLKPYPTNYQPFSKGFCQNWKDAATVREATLWTLPRPLVMYPFNWFDNEYWSCC
jgi:palmitoyltransferase